MANLTLKTFIDSDDTTLYNAITPDNIVIASSSNEKEIQAIIDQVENCKVLGQPTFETFKKIMQK